MKNNIAHECGVSSVVCEASGKEVGINHAAALLLLCLQG